ncbi:MAG: hypothetical protein ACRDRL_15490, partial [Sciscionella sp.]
MSSRRYACLLALLAGSMVLATALGGPATADTTPNPHLANAVHLQLNGDHLSVDGPVTAVHWGNVEPGQRYELPLSLHNNSGAPVALTIRT